VANSVLGTVYTVITSGLGGIGLIAFYQRWIVPGAALDDMKAERDEAKAERDQWKTLYEREREAHQATREGLIAASQRGDAGVEAAKVTISLVEALRGTARQVGNDPGGG
jgi:hypothetical protein